jgi:hypothetical protein
MDGSRTYECMNLAPIRLLWMLVDIERLELVAADLGG